MKAAKILKIIFIIAYILLATHPCILFYEYHFCPDILHYYQIPNEMLCAAVISCLWGMESTFLANKLNIEFWIKNMLILIIYIYAL